MTPPLIITVPVPVPVPVQVIANLPTKLEDVGCLQLQLIVGHATLASSFSCHISDHCIIATEPSITCVRVETHADKRS